MLREKIYELKNWKSVVHTTFNPQGPGVIRIHMVPPKFHPFRMVPSVVILNGQDILPLNESWAILLTEFIRQINTHGLAEMSESDLDTILQNTFYHVCKVFPDVSEELLQEDLRLIMDTFVSVSRGEIPEAEIGLMSIGDYAPHMTAPHRMDLMISAMTKNGSWHCNQKCIHCYAAGQQLSETKELSTEEWKEIISACKKAKIPQLTFTGGEPTMRPDLCELVAEAKWFVTRLNTNGVLLTKDLCAALMEAELDSVQITLYSSDKDIHNALVGADNFDKTVSGIKNALEAGLNVSINTPLCTKNKDYAQTLAFLKELGVSYVTCSGLIVTGNATLNQSVTTQLGTDEIYEVVKAAADYCFAHEMELSFTSPGWISEEKLRALHLTVPSCGACLSNMAIAPNGQVIPCQSWLSGETLGDMRTDKFSKIWNHPMCKMRRNFSAKSLQICPLRERSGETK